LRAKCNLASCVTRYWGELVRFRYYTRVDPQIIE
jgi:hypothetical protein